MRKLIPWVPTSYPNPFTTYTMPDLVDKTRTDAVAWARDIQLRAHLPEEMELVEAKGFREGKDIEWYAAAILRHWYFIQMQFAGGIPQPDMGRDPIVFRGRVQTMKSLTKELDRLINKAQIIVDPHSRKAQKAGKGRGEQQTTAREPEWKMWRTWAKEFQIQFPDIKSKLGIAEKIQGRIWRKEKRRVAIRTITSHI